MLQATEAIKLILGIGESLSGTLLQFDALGMRFNRLRLLRDPACPLCGDGVMAGDYVDLPAACGVGSGRLLHAAELEDRLAVAPELSAKICRIYFPRELLRFPVPPQG